MYDIALVYWLVTHCLSSFLPELKNLAHSFSFQIFKIFQTVSVWISPKTSALKSERESADENARFHMGMFELPIMWPVRKALRWGGGGGRLSSIVNYVNDQSCQP